MLMMRPLLRSIIEGKKACVHMTGPRRLTFITRSQRLRGVSWNGDDDLILQWLGLRSHAEIMDGGRRWVKRWRLRWLRPQAGRAPAKNASSRPGYRRGCRGRRPA